MQRSGIKDIAESPAEGNAQNKFKFQSRNLGINAKFQNSGNKKNPLISERILYLNSTLSKFKTLTKYQKKLCDFASKNTTKNLRVLAPSWQKHLIYLIPQNTYKTKE